MQYATCWPIYVLLWTFISSLYSYQIRDGSSLRQETRETNGLTRGFYSYMDPNGILQRVDYVSDPLNGYKVLSEPMIKDTPEVAKAKADFFKAYQEALNVNLNWVLVLILSIYQIKYMKNMSRNRNCKKMRLTVRTEDFRWN